MNPNKKQRTLPPNKQQEVADPAVQHRTTELMNCADNALEIILKHLKTDSPDDFRANRSLSTRWCLAYYRAAETSKVTTLCVMPASTKPSSEKLKSRFIRDIDIATAVNIRHMPSIEAPKGPKPKDLEDHYPNVTQLFLNQKYFSLCWYKNLTHLSLFEDQSELRNLLSYSSALNKMTSLRSLDLNGHFFAIYELIKPTLERLEQLSVECLSSIESLREYTHRPPRIPFFIAVSRLLPKCTRFWFVQRAEPCNLHYWENLSPDWIPRLTHFGMNNFQNEEFTPNERKERVHLSDCTLNRFLEGRAPALQVLHILDSLITLNPLVVKLIAGMTNLEELNIGVNYHHVALFKAVKEGTHKSWIKVHTLGLTLQRVICYGPGFSSTEMVQIISTLVPNVKHLSLSLTNYYDGTPFRIVFEEILFEQLQNAFTELISFKISHVRVLLYEGKRNEPGEPFVTTVTQAALARRPRFDRLPVVMDDEESEDDDGDNEEEDEEETEEDEDNDNNDNEGEVTDEDEDDSDDEQLEEDDEELE